MTRIDVDVFGVPGAGKTSALRAINETDVSVVIDRPAKPSLARRVTRRLHTPSSRTANENEFYADYADVLRLAAEVVGQEPDREVRLTKFRSVQQMASLHVNRSLHRVCIWDAGWCQRAMGLFTDMDGNVGNVEPFVDALPKPDLAVMFDVDVGTAMARMEQRGFRPIVLRGLPEDRVLQMLEGFRECAERVSGRLQVNGAEVLRLDGSRPVEENVALLLGVIRS